MAESAMRVVARTLRHAGVMVVVLGALTACVALPQARVPIPEDLAGAGEAIELAGLGGRRSGQARADGRALRFERSAERLALFGELNVNSRSAARFALEGAGGSAATEGRCQVRRRTMALGVVEWIAKPLALHCSFAPAGWELELQEHRGAIGTLKVERRGTLQVAGRRFGVRSVHAVEGSWLTLPMPAGYVVEDGGRVRALVELTGTRPRIVLPRDDALLREASLHALLALALAWDPADD